MVLLLLRVACRLSLLLFLFAFLLFARYLICNPQAKAKEAKLAGFKIPKDVYIESTVNEMNQVCCMCGCVRTKIRF